MTAVLSVVAVLLAVAATVQSLELRAAQRRAADQAVVLDVAEAQVRALTSVSAETSGDDLKEILKYAAPSFRRQFEDQAEAFRAALREAKVASQGVVESAGIAEIDGDAASVLVAAAGTVENASTDAEQRRFYRLSVTLRRSSGTWLVTAMEFVA